MPVWSRDKCSQSRSENIVADLLLYPRGEASDVSPCYLKRFAELFLCGANACLVRSSQQAQAP